MINISAPWAARRIWPGTDEQATAPGSDAASPAWPRPADVQLVAQVSPLIGPDQSRYWALIGGTLICHNNTPHLVNQ